MPEDVRREMGRALLVAQMGGRARIATPLREFRGASVLEIRDDFETDTYRCVYTVQFAQAIYVLHAFQKKSRQGTKTPERDLNLIRQRIQAAELDHRGRYGE
jgi:phage-related protein